jgi:hypothetical protein
VKLRKHLVTILLVAGAVGVGVWAYVDAPRLTETERKMRPSSVFNPWRREDLTRIEIHRGGETIVFERDKTAGEVGWRMTSPRPERSDPAAVDRLVGALEFASIVRKVESGATGFDPPRATGKLTMGEVTHTFQLGGPAPTPEGASYFRVGDRSIVVSRELTTQLLLPSDSYRERTVVPYLSIELSRMEVTNAAGRWAIERADEIGFRLAGSNLRASRERLDKVWSALADMRAESFLPDEAGAPAVAKPAVRVVMTPKEGEKPEGELVVGDACPGRTDGVVVVRTKPTRVTACAPKVVLDGLSLSHDTLVDTRLVQAHADEIAGLELRASPSGEVLDLARRGSGWHQRAPMDRDLTKEESDAANELAAAIVRIEGRAGPSRGPLGALSGRVRVERADGVEEVVDVAVPVEGRDQVRATRRFDGAEIAIDRAAWRTLQPRASTLRSREIWPQALASRPARRVLLECAGKRQEAVIRSGVWALLQPRDYAADRESLVGLVDAITRARAEAWVADADDGSFGFRPRAKALEPEGCLVEIAVEGDGGEERLALRFGAEGEGGVYARTEHDPAVFVASRSLRDLASRWLVDRHGLAVERASVARVAIAKARGATITFRSVDDKLRGDDAEKILLALEQLVADDVLDLAPEPADKPELTIEIEARPPGDGGARVIKRILVGPSAATAEGKMRVVRLEGVKATFLVKVERLAAFFDVVK